MRILSKLSTIIMVISLSTMIFSCSDDENNNGNDNNKNLTFEHNGHSYTVVKELKTWVNAAADAVSKGGYLVEIGSEAEHNAVYKGITDAGVSTSYTTVNDGGGIAYVWIGATDRATEGEWLWNGANNSEGTVFWKDGSIVNGNYVNWGGKAAGKFNEPDDFGGKQDAAAIGLANWPAGSSATSGLGKAGEWNDIDETNRLYYVIEFDE